MIAKNKPYSIEAGISVIVSTILELRYALLLKLRNKND